MAPALDPPLPEVRPHRGFSLVRWVLAPALGFPLGLMVIAGIFAAFRIPPSPIQVPFVLHPMAWLPILGGLGLATALQQRAIRAWTSASVWLLATVGGFALALAVQDLPFHPRLSAELVALLTGASIGVCVGTTQALVLRRVARGAFAWIPVNAASFAVVALGAQLATRGRIVGNAATPLVALAMIPAWALMTGLFLRRLLATSNEPPPGEATGPAAA